MLRTRNDFAIYLDRDAALGQPFRLKQFLQRHVAGEGARFAVELNIHGAIVGTARPITNQPVVSVAALLLRRDLYVGVWRGTIGGSS